MLLPSLGRSLFAHQPTSFNRMQKNGNIVGYSKLVPCVIHISKLFGNYGKSMSSWPPELMCFDLNRTQLCKDVLWAQCCHG